MKNLLKKSIYIQRQKKHFFENIAHFQVQNLISLRKYIRSQICWHWLGADTNWIQWQQ